MHEVRKSRKEWSNREIDDKWGQERLDSREERDGDDELWM